MKIVPTLTVTDAVLGSSDVPEDDFTAWNSGTTYAAGDKVRRVVTDIHRTYESAQGSNTNHDPLTDDAEEWWIDLGPTNRWAMFSAPIAVQTVQADQIDVTLNITDPIDTVQLQNISAATVRIIRTHPDDGVVFDETFDMTSTRGIIDAYTYYFNPIVRLRDLLVENLPVYGRGTLRILLEAEGEEVACGLVLVGLSRRVGFTLYGARASTIDYSTKGFDRFGRPEIIERYYAREVSYQVRVPNDMVDETLDLFADYRARLVLVIGSGRYAALSVYGLAQEAEIAFEEPETSILTFRQLGMT